MVFVTTMIHTARGSLLSSTCKLRYRFSCDSLRSLGPLLRNLSTAAERLGFLNPNPTGTCSGQSLNGFYQSSELYSQRQRNWQSGSDDCSSYGNDNQENTGFVHSPSQSYNSGQRQSWTIPPNQSGYDSLDVLCREGNVKAAVEIIKSWRNDGYMVDLPRILWLAQLCGDAQALQEAKVVHEFITSSVSRSDISAYNSITEMYSGCGSVEDALSVFERMPGKNSETWCVIIRCLAKKGHGEEAVDMFSRFKEEGNIPDGSKVSHLMNLGYCMLI